MSWDFLGNEWAVEILQRHAAHEAVQPRHAYLFTGPPGTGRRTLALRFIQAINCLQPPAPGQPCRTCRVCRQVERMQHPDLFVVERLPDKTRILIDQVRSLQHNLSLSPYEGRYRVGLIVRFQEANEEAMNSLLKTLEEPPSRVIVMLTADTPEDLLPTVVSRCEVLRLRPMPLERLANELQTSQKLEPEKARLVAHLASGRYGVALRLAKDSHMLQQRREWLNELHELLDAPRRLRFIFAERVGRDKGNFREVLLVWLSYWRDVLLCAAGADTPLVNLDRQAELQQLAQRFDTAQARARVSQLERSLRLLEANVNPRLLAEVLLLDIK